MTVLVPSLGSGKGGPPGEISAKADLLMPKSGPPIGPFAKVGALVIRMHARYRVLARYRYN